MPSRTPLPHEWGRWAGDRVRPLAARTGGAAKGERVPGGGVPACTPSARMGNGPVCTLWRATPTFPPIPSSSLRATRFVQNRLCKDRRTSHPLSSPPLPFPPSSHPRRPPHSRRREGFPFIARRRRKGAHGKAHEGMPPLPFPSLPLCPRYPVRAERRRTRARRPLAFGPTPSPLAAHSHRRGAYEGTPPPPSPSLPGPSLPMKGRTTTRRPRHLPFPFGRAAPGTRPPIPIAPGPSPLGNAARTRGHGAPERTRVHEGTTPPAAPYARARYTRAYPSPFARGHAAPRPPLPLVRAAPFARKGGMRGVAAHPVAPRSRGNGRTRPRRAVSVRPRSPRPHPVCAA
ncbi:hypothetical protein EDB85DRAFT_2297381 [Lactarius pseudohatsudake]|nr:hypothetical protein EDB85DRAFT_2297381 [Lactarius pseudohatsudake]